MAAAMILSFCISAVLLLLSLIFKVAEKARLVLPVLYTLAAAVSTLFTDWATQHEPQIFIGLYVLIGLVALSWGISLVKAIRRKRQERCDEEFAAWQIRKAREMGVPPDGVTFDENGNLIDPRAGRPVEFDGGVQFR